MNAPSRIFDYVIVGGGSAGCVLAARLSERPGRQVLLIEAGPRDTNPALHMPAGYGKTVTDPRLMWFYQTERDTHHPDAKSYTWLRGKVLGGSSSVNGMIYVRGHPQDYDDWETGGASGWGWKALSAAFRAMEDHQSGPDGVRGQGGPLKVSIQPLTALGKAVVASAAAAGLPARADLNGLEQEGVGPTPCTIAGGRRSSAASAFLKPALRRPNLTVLTDTRVRRLILDGLRVDGVACDDGRVFRAHEVILSAGAIHSPMLLMQAGIGPADSLRRVGAPVICDLPGVGGNLREHKLFTLQAKLNRPLSRNRDYAGPRLAAALGRYLLFRSGPMARTFDVNAFGRSSAAEPRPDLQMTFSGQAVDMSASTVRLHDWHGLTAFGYALRPDSSGHIRLRSPDPDVPPVIVTNFLKAESDQRRTIALARMMRRILATPPLAGLIAAEHYPGAELVSDEDILAAAHRDQSAAHAVGTCRMGTDRLAVVDPQLRVRGVGGLRVVDCSVMPTQVSGNTNGPVMAVAWRAADLIQAQG